MAELTDLRDIFIMSCTSTVVSGVYGSGLNTRVLGEGSGVISFQSSSGVQKGKSVGGEQTEETVESPWLIVDASLPPSGDSGSGSPFCDGCALAGGPGPAGRCGGVEGIGDGGSGGCGGGHAITLTTCKKETNSSCLTEGSVRHDTIASLEANCCRMCKSRGHA